MLKAVSQKNFPLAISLIDLLLVYPSIKADPIAESALSALKTVCQDAWDVVDEAAKDEDENDEGFRSAG